MKIPFLNVEVGLHKNLPTTIDERSLTQVLAQMERDSKIMTVGKWNQKWQGFSLAPGAENLLLQLLEQKGYDTKSVRQKLNL